MALNQKDLQKACGYKATEFKQVCIFGVSAHYFFLLKNNFMYLPALYKLNKSMAP